MTSRELRRLRLRLTLLYTLVSALGLTALGAFLVVADGKLRSDALDSDLRLQAQKAARAIWFDEQGRLQSSVPWDDSLAAGYPQLYVIERRGTRPDGTPDVAIRARPRSPWYVGAPLEAVSEQALLTAGEVIERTTIADSVPIRTLAMPIPDYSGKLAGVVLTIADEQSLSATQNRLSLWVALGCGGLLVLSALAGYLLAGRSIRPATRALQQQERFLADAAHEIRTPVAAIRALAEGAAAGDQPADDAIARTAEIAAEASQTVDDLLFLARADAGRMELEREPLRLDLLVDEVVEDVPGVQLDARPVTVEGDPRLLRRALGNLVANAVRHGRALDPAAAIEVTVEEGHVTVADRGPGIEPGLEGLAFERFQSGRRSGGTGLGLPLAQLVARAHGGEVTLEPREGGGAIAVLALPSARETRVPGEPLTGRERVTA